MSEWISNSPEQTTAWGEALGQLLAGGDVIGLVGPVGAGKTHFVRGVARGAGVPEGVAASPTFAIVSTYEGSLRLHHADLYRVQTLDELYATGFMDLPEPDAALIVEWLDQIPQAALADCLRLEWEPLDDRRRQLKAVATGPRSRQLWTAWEQATRTSR